MDNLLRRKHSNRKTTIIHGIPSTTTVITPSTSNPKFFPASIQTLYVSFLHELSPTDITTLARLLHSHNYSPKTNAKDLESALTALPAHLSSGRKIIDRLPKDWTNLPSPALLCSGHRGLNGRLIRSILNLVKEEVGWKLSTIVAFGSLTNHQKCLINTVRSIHGLWMDAATFAQKLSFKGPTKWTYQLDGCEACILAQIGADAETLQALRTALLSRTQTRSPEKRSPTLLRWVEAWIDTGVASGNEKVEIRYLSGESAKDLKLVRKEAHVRRREAEKRKPGKGRHKTHRRRRVFSKSQSQDRKQHDGEEVRDSKVPEDASTSVRFPQTLQEDSDPENDIIDSYGSFLSPEFLPSASSPPLDLKRKPEEQGLRHPAFRISSSVEVADYHGVYRPVDREVLKRKLREQNEKGRRKRKGKGKAEAKAEEYRSLLHAADEEGEEDLDDHTDESVYSQDEDETVVNSSRARDDESRITRWEDMYQ
jgi:hypothetical protein